MEQDKNIMYKTMRVNGRTHVLREINRLSYCLSDYYKSCKGDIIRVDPPDYLGTGLALCGVLKYGQTLNEWVQEKKKRIKDKLI